MRIVLDDLKTYALEIYGPDSDDELIWRHDSDLPFAPMAVGDAVIVPEADKARVDRPFTVTGIEHVIYTKRPGDVRFVTRLTVGLANRAP